MKTIKSNMRLVYALMLLLSLFTKRLQAQENTVIENGIPQVSEQKRCNFYVFTQDADHKVDFFGGTTLVRICIKSVFLKKKLYVIVAHNSAQVIKRIKAILAREDGLIGNLWLDSHGLYKQGYSSFHIGTDEYSYKNINDTAYTKVLASLAAYTDEQTRIGIGSCYGGATLNFPGSALAAPGRMNGDSLMMGLGSLFNRTTIYGSESWVMIKPGMFNDKFGLAGYPLGKRYRTTYWKPVWRRLGQWNQYSASTGIFEPVKTISIDSEGRINIRKRNYQDLSKGKKAVDKNLTRLETSMDVFPAPTLNISSLASEMLAH